MTVTTTATGGAVAVPLPHVEGAAAAAVDTSGVSAFLGKELRVGISDGRVDVGTLVAFQGSGDLLLEHVCEERRLKDGLVMVRRLNLLAIPFKHVTSLHRRKDGETPLYALEDGEEVQVTLPSK